MIIIILHVAIRQVLEPSYYIRGGEPVAHGPIFPKWTFDMACIRIFITKFRLKKHVRRKLHEKQVLNMFSAGVQYIRTWKSA